MIKRNYTCQRCAFFIIPVLLITAGCSSQSAGPVSATYGSTASGAIQTNDIRVSPSISAAVTAAVGDEAAKAASEVARTYLGQHVTEAVKTGLQAALERAKAQNRDISEPDKQKVINDLRSDLLKRLQLK